MRHDVAVLRYVVCPAALLLSGCSGLEVGEIRVPVEEQHVIPVAGGENALALPADHPFAIHVKKSSQNPGPNGQARGDSDATPAGQAHCLAEAANGGTASAEFDLGHRIDNRSSSAQTVSIQVEFDLRQSTGCSAEAAPETLASANLHLMVMDTRKKVLIRNPIVQATSEQSPGEASVHQRQSLIVKVEPQQSVDVLLFAHVEAGAAGKQEARARIAVSDLKIQMKFSPAASQPAEKSPTAPKA